MGISSADKKKKIKTDNFPMLEKYSYHMIIYFILFCIKQKQLFNINQLIFVQRLWKMF